MNPPPSFDLEPTIRMPKPTLKDYAQYTNSYHSLGAQGGQRTRGISPGQTDPALPLVSIVTVVRNGRKTLEATILSVLAQSYPNIEFIIVDGCSSDGTQDLIKSYEDRIAYWVSEPDLGIADAWNKGVALATGELIGILNADDTYGSDLAERAVRTLAPFLEGFCFSTVLMVDANGTELQVVPGRFDPRTVYRGTGFLYPGSFCTRKTYERMGLFDLGFKLAMDVDWILRCSNAGIPFLHSGGRCYMRNDGVASTGWKAAWQEYTKALAENRFPAWVILSSKLYRVLLSVKKMAWGLGK